MSNREKILAAVKAAQPELIFIDHIDLCSDKTGTLQPFTTILESIGGKVVTICPEACILQKVKELFPEAKRIVSVCPGMDEFIVKGDMDPYSLEDLSVAIVPARMAVAENGAIWITEVEMKIRALPFICEHLVTVVDAQNIVANMHQAYDCISNADYGFGTFIAGPSKTADIEQSLVLGAHGPKSMTVLVVKG